ncbi:hypothetical protein MIN45_P1678 [Methylomarinovum tepidoasis]|uniref:4Fe-4S ferredoxin-type domain-containing protein n=1 Tax=Methylomarinovum tepidoasis TaxID=2840183 RepID=A0AAU9CBL3_9GAMM|nr:RnfABCDGE type electron transport complex subunit B [Methylomarinovum sp. IN45]BCX89306.1 hypothetical protein MIN45_P1678 [Methylomarinovum sp. IN45]
MTATGGRFARVAKIDETCCIGCARCLDACPVDAIVGAPNWMHTVIAAECIGCALCLPPCPVECIDMLPAPESLRPRTAEERRARSEQAKARYRARRRRLEEEAARHRARLEARKAALKRRRAV